MTKNPGKDFAPIAEDYAFFEMHSTEAEQDSRAYLERLAGVMSAAGTIQMLDFGCGSGTFTARFLQQANWPRSRLRLTLVEPVESARQQAVARVATLSEDPIVDSAALPRGMTGTFDVILANHVLYYVPALQNQWRR